MKSKAFLITVLILSLFLLSACAGAGDWVYDKLPGDYEIWRINSEDIALGVNMDGGLERSIDGSVSEFCYNDSFIAVKSDNDYYVVVVKKNTLVGPLSEEEFAALHPGTMCDWISTDSMPSGAHS